MKTLIIYSSKYGTTEKCARIINEGIKRKSEIISIENISTKDISEYDQIIIGSSVYYGRISNSIVKFCDSSLEELKNKRIAFYLCSNNDGINKIEDVIANELCEKADVITRFGGDLNISKMSFIHKLIAKMVSGQKNDKYDVKENEIKTFIKLIE